MKVQVAAFALLCLLAAGCNARPSADVATYSDEKVKVDLLAPPKPADAAAPSPQADVVSLPQLAYDYTYGFAASPDNVETLIKSDQAACDRAGPVDCQMISLSADNNRDAGYVHKTLELRVTPQWLKTWQGGLDAGLKQAHARITSQNVTSEDLSLQIVDSEAHIKNQEALRDRLTEIIKTSSGKVSDLVDAEQQLAQVQEEIDSAQSALAVMQKRVATSHLTLTYESEQAAASNGTFAPVTDALKSVLRDMMTVFGVLIHLFAVLIPLAIVGVPIAWLVLKWRARRKAQKDAEKPVN